MEYPLWSKADVEIVKNQYLTTEMELGVYDEDEQQQVMDLLFDEFWRRMLELTSHRCHIRRKHVDTRAETNPVTFGKFITLTWRPQTNVVAFIAGSLDGRHIAVTDLRHPYKVPMKHISKYEPVIGPNSWRRQNEVYLYNGWDPNSDCWVFVLDHVEDVNV